jgi:glutaredoxin 3
MIDPGYMPKVTVYTMNSCPYCQSAKSLLAQNGIPYSEVLVADDDDAAWAALFQRSGMKTMPQIFADDRLIGGYRELSTLFQKDGFSSLK